MEDIAWKKDETPYIIFPCSKCEQYMYVKETRKTKECLRCGRSHKVSDIREKGESVKGMTNAVETVKRRQEALAIHKLGILPEFRASDDFKLSRERSKQSLRLKEKDDESENLIKFKQILVDLSNQYTKFPLYIIEIFAENNGIKNSKVKLLINRLQREGYLIRSHQDYTFQIHK